MKPWHNSESFMAAVDAMSQSGCGEIGIDTHEFQLEYPFQALMRERNPHIQFVHAGVSNASSRYTREPPARVCAVLCLDCAGKPERLSLYRDFPKTEQAGQFVMFFR